jgi:hypothetical protein
MNFWDNHTLLFCVAMYFFPRLTLLFATKFGGFFWWLSLIFVPRLLVAFLATKYYGDTNPFLCAFVWIWAIRGDLIEKQRVLLFSRGEIKPFGHFKVSYPGSQFYGRTIHGRIMRGKAKHYKPDIVEVDAEIVNKGDD